MPAPRTFRVGLVQMRCAPEPAANLETATLGVPPAGARRSSASRSSSAQREDHACFDLAEPVPGPTTDALGRVARETRAVVIASLFERRAGA